MTARGALAACAAALTVPMTGLAQDAGVTTVEPLVVSPLAPVPEVGQGATYFSPQDLKATAEEARDEHQEARDGARVCGKIAALAGPSPEDVGDFSIGALMATEARDQYQLQQAALRAAQATEAAIAARSAAARGERAAASPETTELARQTATTAYQDAQRKARESHERLADLEDKAWSYVGGDVISLRALELGVFIPGCVFDPLNPSELMKGLVQQDCSEAPMDNKRQYPTGYVPLKNKRENMRQFQSWVDDRSRVRAQNGGQETVFVPDEFRDLKLSDIVAWREAADGKDLLRIRGKINNPRAKAIATPPLWVSAIDRYGTSLYSQQIIAPGGNGRIPARGSLTFAYAVDPMPGKTARASVTFAPLHHAPAGLPASAFCMPILGN